jgi:cytochrome P450
MMPAFTSKAINRSLPQLEQVVSEWLGRWEAAGEPVRAWDSFKALTFDYIMRVSPGWRQVQAGSKYNGAWQIQQRILSAVTQ